MSSKFTEFPNLLEPQLGEKPLVFSGVVSFLKHLGDFDARLSPFALLYTFFCHQFLKVNVQSIPCWHEMIVIDDTDEGFDTRSLCNFLFAH